MAIKLVLTLAHRNVVSQIEMYGLCLLMIQCAKREFNLCKFTQQPLFHNILLLKSTFSHIFFMKVYRDKNYEGNMLFKDGVALENGIWKITDKTPTHSFEYLQPFGAKFRLITLNICY
jgi:hypothetical protein